MSNPKIAPGGAPKKATRTHRGRSTGRPIVSGPVDRGLAVPCMGPVELLAAARPWHLTAQDHQAARL